MTDEQQQQQQPADEKKSFVCIDCGARTEFAYASLGWHPDGWHEEDSTLERGWLTCREHRRKNWISTEFVLDDVLDGRLQLGGDRRKTLARFLAWLRETYMIGENR